MREFLIVLACVIVGIALRSCRTLLLRKLGALVFLIATALAFSFICGCWWSGIIGIGLWFLFPWFDILTRIRQLRLPLNNRLSYKTPPSEDYFPNASRMISEIEEAGFEHVIDSGWNWAGMQQYFRIYWNPELKAVASVCLCEHESVAFAFATISAHSDEGLAIHTTNYPFSPTLKHPPNSRWDHLPCEKNRFPMVFHDHEKHLARLKIGPDCLLMPDPDEVVSRIENEMRNQIDHNVDRGLITLTGDGHFRYSVRGLFFLWKQSVKDMIRLC
ncbi:MAG: hypothetical protein ACSHYF_01290 [Verrucomicrobiaceae bacterium]